MQLSTPRADGETQLKTGLDLTRLEKADAPIHSLMPEPGRAQRLERAMSTAPSGPLLGLLFGVKDIFHMRGARAARRDRGFT